MTTRGCRNNNPGNIKASSIDWEGTLAFDDRSDEQKAEKTFVVFRGAWWGIRAMAKILQTYFHRHELNTVHQIISRWAPGNENPTVNYALFVANHLNVELSDELDLDDYKTARNLICAIIAFENGGNPYSWEIDAGLILAGIEPNTSPCGEPA